ncbi:MAG: 23S rRNA (guanosine(2251)-2'-O)-methyltransferase RlmB [Candidatus Binatia bacterium]
MKQTRFVNRRQPPIGRPRRIYGVHPVTAWLRSHPRRLEVVHYDGRFRSQLGAILDLAAAAGVPREPCAGDRLTSLAGTSRHQGIVATAGAFPYLDLEGVLDGPVTPRLLVVADHLQDPHNLGALLRTANAAGAGAVITPKDGAVGVTASVEAVAAGAAALVPVCRVTNTVRALRALKARGYWCVGLMPRNGLNLYRFQAPQRVVVVVGGETGMRPLLAKLCDVGVSIPMRGRVESLNASVAAAIVLYELIRQWQSGESGVDPIVSNSAAV